MATKRRRTEIPCVMCSHPIKLPEYIGQDYSGDLLCNTCMSLLRIKLDKSEVKELRVLENRFKEWKGFEKLRKLREIGAKALAEPEKSNKARGE